MSKKLTYDFVKSEFEKRGYELLDKEYINAHTKMRYKCPKHSDKIFQIDYNHLQQGNGCPLCGNEKIGKIKRLSYDFVKKEFESQGYTLVDTEYINSWTRMRYICSYHPNDILFMSYNDFQQGHRCKLCMKEKISERMRSPYERVKQDFLNKGYILLEKEYKNAHQKLSYKCLKHPDKKLFITYTSLKSGKGCPYCSFKGTSYPEQFLYFCLKNKFKNTYNRYKIDELEYDIYIEDLNLAIEYNGCFWHKNSQERDQIKEENCNKKNIDFIRIEELKDNNSHIYWEGNHLIIPCNVTANVLSQTFMYLIKYINKKYHTRYHYALSKDIENKVFENIKVEKYNKSIIVTHPDECKDWDYDKNGELKPEFFTKSSLTKIFWKCHKCGYSWKQSVRYKILGRCCPNCSSNNMGCPKPVDQYDLDGNFIQSFSSITEASEKLKINNRNTAHIAECCKGKIKFAYGFLWKYKNE